MNFANELSFLPVPGLRVPMHMVRAPFSTSFHQTVPLIFRHAMNGWNGGSSFEPGEWLKAENRPILFRAVALKRLPVILRTGTDVEPVSRHLWALPNLDIGLYGGEWADGKVIQVLKRSELKRTWTEVPATISDADLRDLRQTYPTMYTSSDGSSHWLTRLPDFDGAPDPYEESCCYWIPGDPWEALHSLYVLIDSESSLSEEDAFRGAPALQP
jgi:hypothetical protein